VSEYITFRLSVSLVFLLMIPFLSKWASRSARTLGPMRSADFRNSPNVRLPSAAMSRTMSMDQVSPKISTVKLIGQRDLIKANLPGRAIRTFDWSYCNYYS